LQHEPPHADQEENEGGYGRDQIERDRPGHEEDVVLLGLGDEPMEKSEGAPQTPLGFR
jgi:hypothetical protein